MTPQTPTSFDKGWRSNQVLSVYPLPAIEACGSMPAEHENYAVALALSDLVADAGMELNAALKRLSHPMLFHYVQQLPITPDNLDTYYRLGEIGKVLDAHMSLCAELRVAIDRMHEAIGYKEGGA